MRHRCKVMTLTPSVRAMSLCSFPCVARPFACASFVAISALECLFFLAISFAPYLHLSQVLFDPPVLEPPTHVKHRFTLPIVRLVIAIMRIRAGDPAIGRNSHQHGSHRVPASIIHGVSFFGQRIVSGICRGCADQAPCSGVSGVVSIPDLIIWALFGGCCALPCLAAVSVGRLRLKPRRGRP